MPSELHKRKLVRLWDSDRDKDCQLSVNKVVRWCVLFSACAFKGQFGTAICVRAWVYMCGCMCVGVHARVYVHGCMSVGVVCEVCTHLQHKLQTGPVKLTTSEPEVWEVDQSFVLCNHNQNMSRDLLEHYKYISFKENKTALLFLPEDLGLVHKMVLCLFILYI